MMACVGASAMSEIVFARYFAVRAFCMCLITHSCSMPQTVKCDYSDEIRANYFGCMANLEVMGIFSLFNALSVALSIGVDIQSNLYQKNSNASLTGPRDFKDFLAEAVMGTKNARRKGYYMGVLISVYGE
jgi:hypothetical protein